MHRSKILVRTLFIIILLAGLVAGFFLPSLIFVRAEPQQFVSTSIVISQVYGGGGNSGATLKNDFIELHNLGSSPVDVTGWSVQYASASGASWSPTPLSGIIKPGQYYLIQEAVGSSGTANLPTPIDATGTIAMSATAGKVQLVDNNDQIIDLVGYGTTANPYEGSGPAPAPSNTTADIRKGNGCTDTDNNSVDFTAGNPSPRNSSSPLALCMAPSTVTAVANLTSTAAYNLTATENSNLTATASAATPTPTATLTSTPTFTPTNTSTPASTGTSTFTPTATNTSTSIPTQTPTFTSTNTPTSTSTAFQARSVVINEIAWAGTVASSSDEWMELYNPTSSGINLNGWLLKSDDGNININLNGTI